MTAASYFRLNSSQAFGVCQYENGALITHFLLPIVTLIQCLLSLLQMKLV